MNNPNTLSRPESDETSETPRLHLNNLIAQYYNGLTPEDIDQVLEVSDNLLEEDMARIHGLLKYRGENLTPSQISSTLSSTERGLEETYYRRDAGIVDLIIRRCSANMSAEQIPALADLLITYCDNHSLNPLEYILNVKVQGEELPFSSQQFDRIITQNNKHGWSHNTLLQERGQQLSLENLDHLTTKFAEIAKEGDKDDIYYMNKALTVIARLHPEDQPPESICNLLDHHLNALKSKEATTAIALRWGDSLSKSRRRKIEKSYINYLDLFWPLLEGDQPATEWIKSLIDSNLADLLSEQSMGEDCVAFLTSKHIDKAIAIAKENDERPPWQLYSSLKTMLFSSQIISTSQFCQIFNLTQERYAEYINPNLSRSRSDFFSPERINEIIETQSGRIIPFLVLDKNINLSDEQLGLIAGNHWLEILKFSGKKGSLVSKLEQHLSDNNIAEFIGLCENFSALVSFAVRNHQRLSPEQLVAIAEKAPKNDKENPEMKKLCELLRKEIDKLTEEKSVKVLEIIYKANRSLFSAKQELKLLTVICSPHILEELTSGQIHKLDADSISDLISRTSALKQELILQNKNKRIWDYRERLQALHNCLMIIVQKYEKLTTENIDSLINAANGEIAQTLVEVHSRQLLPRQMKVLAGKCEHLY